MIKSVAESFPVDQLSGGRGRNPTCHPCLMLRMSFHYESSDSWYGVRVVELGKLLPSNQFDALQVYPRQAVRH